MIHAIVLLFALSAPSREPEMYRGVVSEHRISYFELGYVIEWRGRPLHLVLSGAQQLEAVRRLVDHEAEISGYRGERGATMYLYVLEVAGVE